MIIYFTNIFIKIKSNLNNLNLFNYYIIKKNHMLLSGSSLRSILYSLA